MNPNRWKRIEEIYHTALELEESQRAGFLEQVYGEDDELCREVESLLTADAQAEGFMESPALEVVAQSMEQGPPSLVGRQLGPYRVLDMLGAGGMGEVYRARDTRLNRTVAVKILPRHFSKRPDLHERFEREARAIASLNHPHICALYDIGHEGEIEYLVMEYLEGETLSARLKREALPLGQVLGYAIEIASALDEAHRHGIVHRDLKPGNIMLTRNGSKLLDFGLAKHKVEAASSRLLEFGHLHGLPCQRWN